VVRYHSLVVDTATLPACLTQTAWTAPGSEGGAGVLMALSHTAWPHHGVQFHPESVATAFGDALLRNFRALTEAHWAARGRGANTAPTWTPPGRAALARAPSPASSGEAVTRVRWRRLPDGAAAGSDALFWALFAPTEAAERDTWWLDSATTADGRARFSFMVRAKCVVARNECNTLTHCAVRHTGWTWRRALAARHLPTGCAR
jgi:para-aminobenzoate synthetase